MLAELRASNAGMISLWLASPFRRNSRAEVLVRARIADFERGNLRAVVEGLGPE